MDENPYRPPEHFASRPESEIPFTAYVVVAGTLIVGAAMIAFGAYYLLPRTTLGGLFWFGIGMTGAYYIVTYRRKGIKNSPVTPSEQSPDGE